MRQLPEGIQQGVFYRFFESYHDSMLILDLDGCVIEANPAALVLLGYSMEELRQGTIDKLILTTDESENVFGGDVVTPLELMFRHKFGHRIYTRVVLTPLVIEDGPLGTIVTIEDVTSQKEQRQELLDIQEMFSFISEKSQNIISSISSDGIFTYISPTVKALLGYTPQEVIGRPAAQFNHPTTNEDLLKLRHSLSPSKTTERFTGRVIHKNGEYRWYETTVQYIRNESGEVVQSICVGRDITDRKEAEETIAHLAYHDSLTDLPNRRLLKNRMTEVLEQSMTQLHGLMLLDLDNFKNVNDTFGHDVGDLLLINVGRKLRHLIGPSGIVSRLGGDEFTIFQANIKDPDEWARLVNSVTQILSDPIMIQDHSFNVSASIGVAFYPADGESVKSLMRSADAAMYRVKNREKK